MQSSTKIFKNLVIRIIKSSLTKYFSPLHRQNYLSNIKETNMPRFEIEVDICLGFSHSGGVYNDGFGEVELSDKEVEQLVNLMKEKGTSDIEELELQEMFPEIYDKLDAAYRSVAYQAEEEHWLDEGYYHEECHNFDNSEMIEYLKEKGFWNFEYDEEEYKDENGQIDKDALEWAESDYLSEAMDDYLGSLDGEERYDFLRNKVGIAVDPEGCEYEIKIPDEIVVMAFPMKK